MVEALPPLKPDPPKQILAICGGGYAGVFAAEFLARLEGHTGRKSNEMFDLVSGTSIGGILALGLARGLPASVLSKLLQDIGPVLFGKPTKGVMKPKHDASPLAAKLSEIFGKETLAKLPVQVVIPAVDLTGGETVLFRNVRGDATRTTTLVDVALATSAAPTYLPPHASDERLFADGGLSANSPEGLAANEAINRRRWNRGKTTMLVVGSTRRDARIAGHHISRQWGITGWGLDLLHSTMTAQMSLARQMAIDTLGAANHHVVDALLSSKDEKVIDLDKATPAATQSLKTLAADAFARFEREDAVYLGKLRSLKTNAADASKG